jgi:hypothetical protein
VASVFPPNPWGKQTSVGIAGCFLPFLCHLSIFFLTCGAWGLTSRLVLARQSLIVWATPQALFALIILEIWSRFLLRLLCPQYSYFMLSAVTRLTGMHHHTQQLVEMGLSWPLSGLSSNCRSEARIIASDSQWTTGSRLPFLFIHVFQLFSLMIPDALPLFLTSESSLSFVTLSLLIHTVKWRKLLIHHSSLLSQELSYSL